ncbi:hypothetical protein PR048_024695 [Dryococelus australis]|uniref:Uncharacterized protein n=1 Tax=Dryococelus australis TaxID=614101 RepID=A0ABQ9GPA5_9NEOP|nr:hypothetical protein PR048_024695 [Dryococelus australis]
MGRARASQKIQEKALEVNGKRSRHTISQHVCNGCPVAVSLVAVIHTYRFSRPPHSSYWFVLRAPSVYSTEQAPAYLATLHHEPLEVPAGEITQLGSHQSTYILKGDWTISPYMLFTTLGDSTNSFEDKLHFKNVYIRLPFPVRWQFVRHALDEFDPVTELQETEHQIPCYLFWNKTWSSANEQLRKGHLFIGCLQEHNSLSCSTWSHGMNVYYWLRLLRSVSGEPMKHVELTYTCMPSNLVLNHNPTGVKIWAALNIEVFKDWAGKTGDPRENPLISGIVRDDSYMGPRRDSNPVPLGGGGGGPDRATPEFSHVGIVLDDAAGRRVFLGVLPFSHHPCIPALLHTRLTSTSPALKISFLKPCPKWQIWRIRCNSGLNARKTQKRRSFGGEGGMKKKMPPHGCDTVGTHFAVRQMTAANNRRGDAEGGKLRKDFIPFSKCAAAARVAATGGVDPLRSGRRAHEGGVSEIIREKQRITETSTLKASTFDGWLPRAMVLYGDRPMCYQLHHDDRGQQQVYTRQKSKSKYRNHIQLERASRKQSSDAHKTPYDRVERCRERKINIKVSERVNVDVFTILMVGAVLGLTRTATCRNCFAQLLIVFKVLCGMEALLDTSIAALLSTKKARCKNPLRRPAIGEEYAKQRADIDQPHAGRIVFSHQAFNERRSQKWVCPIVDNSYTKTAPGTKIKMGTVQFVCHSGVKQTFTTVSLHRRMNKVLRRAGMLIIQMVEENRVHAQVDLKQGFRKCSVYREQTTSTEFYPLVAPNPEMAYRFPDLSVLLCLTDTNVVASYAVVCKWRLGVAGGRSMALAFILSRSMKNGRDKRGILSIHGYFVFFGKHGKYLLPGYSSASCKQSLTESIKLHHRDNARHSITELQNDKRLKEDYKVAQLQFRNCRIYAKNVTIKKPHSWACLNHIIKPLQQGISYRSGQHEVAVKAG